MLFKKSKPLFLHDLWVSVTVLKCHAFFNIATSITYLNSYKYSYPVIYLFKHIYGDSHVTWFCFDYF